VAPWPGEAIVHRSADEGAVPGSACNLEWLTRSWLISIRSHAKWRGGSSNCILKPSRRCRYADRTRRYMYTHT